MSFLSSPPYIFENATGHHLGSQAPSVQGLLHSASKTFFNSVYATPRAPMLPKGYGEQGWGRPGREV